MASTPHHPRLKKNPRRHAGFFLLGSSALITTSGRDLSVELRVAIPACRNDTLCFQCNRRRCQRCFLALCAKAFCTNFCEALCTHFYNDLERLLHNRFKSCYPSQCRLYGLFPPRTKPRQFRALAIASSVDFSLRRCHSRDAAMAKSHEIHVNIKCPPHCEFFSPDAGNSPASMGRCNFRRPGLISLCYLAHHAMFGE